MTSPTPLTTREKWQSLHDRCLAAAGQASNDLANAHLVQSFIMTAGIALDKLLQIDKYGEPNRSDLP